MNKIQLSTDIRKFTMICNDFLESNKLNGYEKLIFIILKKFANDNGECFPSLQKLTEISGFSKKTVQRVLKSLEEKEVLSVTHRRTQKGNISNLYTIYDYAEMWRTENKDEKPQKKNSPQKVTEESPEPNANDTLENINCQAEKYTLQEIKEYYDYDILINDYSDIKKDIDSVMSILYDTLNSSNKRMKIMGEQKPVMVVQSKLLRLNYEHILYSIKKFDSVTQKIKNPSAYMLSILYQAEEQMNLDFKNQINYTMYT